MAFAVTSRISDTGATATASKTSASFTPSANSLLVVAATAQRENHTDAMSWSISDSVGLTWTARPVGGTADIAGNFGGDLIVWTAPVGGSPAAMTVTVDPFTTLNTAWIGLSVFDITGHNVSTPLAQAGATNTTTSTGNSVSLTVTLGSAPSSANLVVGIFTGQNDVTGAFASISGFTELQNPTGVNDHIGVWYRTGTTTAAVTCTDLGQGVNWGAAIALEVATASGGTAYDKTPADPVGITDAASDVVDGVRTAADPVGVTDSAAAAAAAVRAPADPVGVTDSATAEAGRSVADPVGVTDSATQVVTGDRAAPDPLGVTDSAAPLQDLARTAADPVGVTDSTTAELGQLHAPADAVGITDTVVAELAADRSVSDPIGVTDSATAQLTGAAVSLLGTFARSSADPHSITIPGATAGRDVWLLVNTAAVVTTPSGWTQEASRVSAMGSYVLHLPGESNPGGSIGVTLDLSGARALAAVAFESASNDATLYASLIEPVNSNSVTWGTGAHTFTSRQQALAVYMFHGTPANPQASFDVSSFDGGFVEFADTGWAGTGGSGDEAARVVVGQASGVAMSASGVVVTLDTAQPIGSAVGFVAFDLDTGLVGVAADPIGVTDSATVVATLDRAPADPLGVTDSAAPDLAATRTVGDAVGVTDAVSAVLGQLVADPVGVTDAATAQQATTRTPADAVGVTDSATADLVAGSTDYTKSPADPVGVTDVAATAVAYVRTVADLVGVTDTDSPQTIDIGYDLADPAGVTDTAATVAAMVRAAADPVGITDTASAALDGSGTIVRTLDDAVGVTDTVAPAVAATRTAADAVGVADAVALAVTRSPADAVSVTDSMARLAALGRQVDDTVGVADTVTVARLTVVTVADAVGVTDDASNAGDSPWFVWRGGALVRHRALLGGVHPTTVDVT